MAFPERYARMVIRPSSVVYIYIYRINVIPIEKDFKFACARIQLIPKTRVVVICFYRPPSSDISVFLDYWMMFVSQVVW